MKRLRFYLMTDAVSFTILILLQAISALSNRREMHPDSLLQLFAITTAACALNMAVEKAFKLQLRALLAAQYVTGLIVVAAGTALFRWSVPDIATLATIFAIFTVVFFGSLGVNSIREKKAVDDINRKLKEIK